jgi:rod shape-determining protein MreB
MKPIPFVAPPVRRSFPARLLRRSAPAIRLAPVKRLFYGAFDAERLVVRRVAGGRQWEDLPQVAVDELDRVQGIGREAAGMVASTPWLRIRNGFADPAQVVSDPDAAVVLIRHPISTMLNRHWWTSLRAKSPDLILHPLARTELTPLEELGLQELGRRVSTRSVHVWIGAELTLEPISTFQSALAGLRADLGRMVAPLERPW